MSVASGPDPGSRAVEPDPWSPRFDVEPRLWFKTHFPSLSKYGNGGESKNLQNQNSKTINLSL